VDNLGGAGYCSTLPSLPSWRGVEAVVAGEGAVEVGRDIGVDVEETGGEVEPAAGAWIETWEWESGGGVRIIIVISSQREGEKWVRSEFLSSRASRPSTRSTREFRERVHRRARSIRTISSATIARWIAY